IGPLRKKRYIFRNALLFRTGEFRVLVKLGVGGGAEGIALLHGLRVLGVGEFVAARFAGDAAAGTAPQGRRGAQSIGVESDTVGDFPGSVAAVTEMES